MEEEEGAKSLQQKSSARAEHLITKFSSTLFRESVDMYALSNIRVYLNYRASVFHVLARGLLAPFPGPLTLVHVHRYINHYDIQ